VNVYRLPRAFDASYRVECGDLNNPVDWCCAGCSKPIPYDREVCEACAAAIARGELSIGTPEAD